MEQGQLAYSIVSRSGRDVEGHSKAVIDCFIGTDIAVAWFVGVLISVIFRGQKHDCPIIRWIFLVETHYARRAIRVTLRM